MPSTTFVNGVTLTDDDWFNEINDAVFEGVGLSGFSTVASATTPDIFASTISGRINYTGTTTCTGFSAAPAAGAMRVLVCSAAAVFTAGANMLIDGVTSGNNLTCAQYDKVYVYAITTTQFLLTRVPYAGTAGSFVKIGATQNASSSASVDFTSASYATAFNGTYDKVVVQFTDVLPATANVTLQAVISQSSSFKTDAGYNNASTDGGTASAAAMRFHATTGIANTSTYGATGDFVFAGMNGANIKKGLWNFFFHSNAGNATRVSGGGMYVTNTTAIDGFRFEFSSGNIASGKFTLYGLEK